MKRVFIFLLLSACVTAMEAQSVYFVESGGTGSGASWNDAGDLQTVLNSVSSGAQILVKSGIYYGFFTIHCPVALYGGCDGTENSLADRQLNWNNPTILSTGNQFSSCLSCDHALTDSGQNNCIIDGFLIIQSGHDALFGGGLRFYDALNITLRNLVFEGNMAQAGGGASLEHCTGRIENVIFRNNKAWDACGGLFLSYCSDMTLVNVLFEGNDATLPPPNGYTICHWGGALFAEHTVAELVNCTFVANNVADSGSGIALHASTLHVTNSIFDRVEFLRLGNPGIDPSYIHFEYCDIWQCAHKPAAWSLQYSQCIHHNPLFGSGYHLQSGSLCKDAGDNSFVPSNVLWDLDLQSRFSGNAVDMGAYEFH